MTERPSTREVLRDDDGAFVRFGWWFDARHPDRCVVCHRVSGLVAEYHGTAAYDGRLVCDVCATAHETMLLTEPVIAAHAARTRARMNPGA